MVTHVLLAGIYQWLMVPAVQLADSQRLGYQAATALAGQHLLAQAGHVPTLSGFLDERLQQRLVVRAAGEVLPLVRVAVKIIE